MGCDGHMNNLICSLHQLTRTKAMMEAVHNTQTDTNLNGKALDEGGC